MLSAYFKSIDRSFVLILDDTFRALNALDYKFDMVFVDPPYFLSNDGLTVQNGVVTSVNKGSWDRPNSWESIHKFNLQWLGLVKGKMKEDATIWISGTMHNIFSIGQALTELEFKILNVVTWEKTNPPPNFSRRYFTHSTEQIIWAKKHTKARHYYDYELMKRLNGGAQMKDVWRLPAIFKWEKNCGKHPTQKPLSLLARIILASTLKGAWILDPFTGSSTTGIAANLLRRRFVGIDKEIDYLELSKARKEELMNPAFHNAALSKLYGLDKRLLEHYRITQNASER